VRRLITEDIPAKVAADKAGNTQKNNDRQKARIEHDKALVRVMYGVMKDDTELFKQFSDDPMFRRRLAELVFEQTYEQLERERAGAA
jgi:type I restriction enzyme, R subunit